MKAFLLLLAGCLVVTGAERTSVEFVSLSVQIFPARTDDAVGATWDSGLSSVGSQHVINHELNLATQDHGYSHEGYFILENDFGTDPFAVPFVLDIPDPADLNNNGVEDFFDFAMPVDGIRTTGQHPDANGRPQNFSATWSRAAGDATGNVLTDLPFLGLRFQHGFQLLRYTGDFTFERTNSELRGSIAITNVLDVQDAIAGALAVRIVSPTTISLGATNWTASGAGGFSVVTNIFDRLTGTNFISYVALQDGYLQTSERDYVDWLLILGSADTNNNGKPDLTEIPSSGEAPRLEIARLPNGTVQITIHGSPGASCTLEFATALPATTWQTSQTITLFGGVQAITVSASGSRRFFRVRQ